MHHEPYLPPAAAGPPGRPPDAAAGGGALARLAWLWAALRHWPRLPAMLARVREQRAREPITHAGRVLAALVPADDLARLRALDANDDAAR